MKTVWLSFVGDDGFRGVVVVDVSEEEEASALALAGQIFPGHQDASGTVLAALRTTHRTGCNPGGHVECTELDPERLPAVARNTLFSKADLQALGLA